MSHISFPSIGGLHNVRALIERYPHIGAQPYNYRAKIKLHGTNAGIQITPEGPLAQYRNMMTSQDDVYGFGAWVEKNRALFDGLYQDRPFTIFGEWCGTGVQKKTALSKIGCKIFAVFMIQYGESDDPASTVVTDPDEIRAIVPETDDLIVLDWLTEPVQLDLTDVDGLKDFVATANTLIAEIEACDPFIKERFGIEGTGEGAVFYPLGVTSRMRIGDLTFKAKGTKHKVNKTREAVQVDPEVLKSREALADMVATEARFEQGFEEVCRGTFDIKQLGAFIAWVCQDAHKESQDEIKASGLEWKPVSKLVAARARDWFLAQDRIAA